MSRALIARLLLAALVVLGQVGGIAHALDHLAAAVSAGADDPYDAPFDPAGDGKETGARHVHDCSLCAAFAPAFLPSRPTPPDPHAAAFAPRACTVPIARDAALSVASIRGPPV